MALTEKAIEATGTINDLRQLILDEQLSVTGPTKVRVIIWLPDDAEIDGTGWLQGPSSNPAFDFLNDKEEDIYTLRDGTLR